MSSDEIALRRGSPQRTSGRRPRPGPGVVPVAQVGPLEAWAGLDPTGLAPRVVRVARLLPGVVAVERRVLVPVERRLLDLVAERLQSMPPRGFPPAAEPRRPRPRQRLAALVDDALAQTPSEGRDDLYRATLDRLVPDEVRILAVLADGDGYPVVHVLAGRGGTAVLSNASPAGRAAGVVLPERTGIYLTTLLALGLVRLGPAEATLRDGFAALLDDPQVRAARVEASRATRFGRARIERRTLRISDFGVELWAECRPTRARSPR